MDSSSFFLTTVLAATIGFFTIFKKLRLHQEEDEETSSPPSSLSPSSSPSSLNRIWTHHVFPSFRGEDVRRDFLSHIQMEFQRMGITPFIDNEIKRGESIGPELIRAIRGSKIAIILLSRNYASSSWCLDELVEIMKCKEELGQIVMVVFYKVDPSDVKKLTGEFGKIFRKTCAGKTKQDTGRWRQALAKVATIAGYHSSNWDNEAAMIKQISTDISNELNNSALSSDFDGLVGMRAHLKKMEPLLCLDSDEVRMIGIWGPSGIGKTTIARVAYNKFSNNFQLSVFMESIEVKYTRPCSDDYSAKLHLQQLFMSQITNQNDMKISHLGVVKDRLKDKKVLVILDGVDQSIQLEAMAKETRWFGPGSRIIITTQNRKIFRTHGINHIYKVDFPPDDEALQIFCTYAFGQKSSKDGFKELAREVTKLAGKLPLGLRVMGSYFRGMSKQEWAKELPRLRTSLDTDIQSILKFSYDALDDEEKYLFLHIACFFNYQVIEKVVTHLSYLLLDARRGLNVLAEKSLISIEYGRVSMHNLLVQLGRDIVRKQSVREPGQRLYLVDGREICEILTDDVGTNRRFIGINFDFGVKSVKKKFSISERAFQGMTNLQFLKLKGIHNTLDLLRGLEYMSGNLRLLLWMEFPMTCLPPIFKLELLVEIELSYSKLEKLWEGIKLLPNLKWMDLRSSKNLMELPDLSTANNLLELNLQNCSSLVNLPSTIGYTKNLQKLNLGGCSSLISLPSFIGNFINLKTLNLSRLLNLVELPSFVGNATNLENLDLSDCSSLVKLPFSIGNLQKLQTLILDGCSKLEYLPTDINLESLDILDLTNCLLLKLFPVISTNLSTLHLTGTAIEEVPSSIKSWSRLTDLLMTYSVKLKECPHAFDVITELHVDDKEIQELPPWVNEFSRLQKLRLYGCKKLVSIPQIPDSLTSIVAEDCESLERLDFSFQNPKIYSLNFDKCFKLNQEARDLIIQKQTITYAVLPGGEVPAYFTHRTATGGSLKINLNEKPLPIFMRFKACILLVNEGDNDETCSHVYVTCKNSKMGLSLFATSWIELDDILTEHLYIFEVEMDVISSELIFEFKVRQDDWEIGQCNWKIGQCGVIQLLEVP
ncbi:probable disease resistance protein RPP1 isoform X2 [Capsella rubella]|uniref:probable disease resistance protein RPP1 isoform X2 n=1 Tax=Capsella rubella TaxID=81985 RepID=UPI000CD5864E|nr:probable disease resistance protein RPP1 isoform X2 [Capsella rubella]